MMIPFNGRERDDAAVEMARIAREAGATLLAMHGTGVETERKSDGSPVSLADRAAEAIIESRLRATFPGIAIVSEENEASQTLQPGGRFFLVDPLDGTRAYLRDAPDFCVLIALIENGNPIAAALDAPARGKRYWSGAQAWVASTEGDDPGRRIIASASTAMATAVISAYNAAEASRRVCGQHGISSVVMENSALKFARLAEGEADIYPRAGRTMQWDVAAGDALLRALGGGVRTPEGEVMTYGYSTSGWVVPGFIAYRRMDHSGR